MKFRFDLNIFEMKCDWNWNAWSNVEIQIEFQEWSGREIIFSEISEKQLISFAWYYLSWLYISLHLFHLAGNIERTLTYKEWRSECEWKRNDTFNLIRNAKTHFVTHFFLWINTLAPLLWIHRHTAGRIKPKKEYEHKLKDITWDNVNGQYYQWVSKFGLHEVLLCEIIIIIAREIRVILIQFFRWSRTQKASFKWKNKNNYFLSAFKFISPFKCIYKKSFSLFTLCRLFDAYNEKIAQQHSFKCWRAVICNVR